MKSLSLSRVSFSHAEIDLSLQFFFFPYFARRFNKTEERSIKENALSKREARTRTRTYDVSLCFFSLSLALALFSETAEVRLSPVL